MTRHLRPVLLVLIGIVIYYFVDRQIVTVVAPPKPSSVKPLEKAILFQPVFLWSDSKETRQGTGFLVKTPDGKVAGITSSHFIKFDGKPLKKSAWTDIQTGKPAVRFSKCFGLPGDGGTSSIFSIDLRLDYLILLAESDVTEDRLLQLDARSHPVVGERVFFPNKDAKSTLGYHVVNGSVTEVQPGYISVELDSPVAIKSQSGSPILSQATGKVIGTLSRSLGKETKSLSLTPSKSIIEAISQAREFPDTDKVIGKATLP